MARMMPAIPPASIANRAERNVYEELARQLPSDWVVRFHFTTCWKEGPYLRDHEGDFIVIAPGKGIIFIEVKGSKGYEARDGKWYRISDVSPPTETRNPFDQVTGFSHGVMEHLSRKLGVEKSSFPGVYGHVVIYPNAKVRGPLPPSQDKDAMIISQQMPQLGQVLTSLFAKWGNPLRGRTFSGEAFKKSVTFFSDEFKMVPVLTQENDDDGKQIEELTQRQWRAFKGILGNRRVKILGAAGSGKTLLACWSAGKRAFDGERVLLLCFNKCLAEWIRRTISINRSFEILHYHAWIASLCRRIGKGDMIGKGAESWDNQVLDTACNALDEIPLSLKFDTIIVDEAQDFRPEWWLPIQMALKSPDDGGLALFMDSDQAAMYGNYSDAPDGLVEYAIEENCRNGIRIANYAGAVIGRNIRTLEGAPQGAVTIETAIVPRAEDRWKMVRSDLISLLDAGINPSGIAVLSPWSRENPRCALQRTESIHGKPLIGGSENLGEWISGNGIWTSTIKAFKGMEASHIILCDVPEPGSPGFDKADLYVGVTRAKLGLKIIAESEVALRQMLSLLSANFTSH